jgi:signal transduction histidine kinase
MLQRIARVRKRPMSLSRFRVRLSAGFAIAFALGLGVLSAAALGYLWKRASDRLVAGLRGTATEALNALARELTMDASRSVADAAREVVAEWPRSDETFVILDDQGAVVAVHAAPRDAAVILSAFRRAPRTSGDLDVGDIDGRAFVMRQILARPGAPANVGVISYASTEGIERDVLLLANSLALAVPIIVLLSFAVGYVLAGRALAPVDDLRRAISAISPSDLSMRVPAGSEPDEIGQLAAAFNTVLARLEGAQKQNRRFVREAAHQIRTPLTLVVGEAGNELALEPPDAMRSRRTLSRIRSAAEQMERRVNELMLLAEAQAGETVTLRDEIETDALILECTDLMRGRAMHLGHTLALGTADSVVVRGNATLLKEALLELIENACKDGDATAPVEVSSHVQDHRAIISVQSEGPVFTETTPGPDDAPTRLGLPIVRWIARIHGGDVKVERHERTNTVLLTLPIGAVIP